MYTLYSTDQLKTRVAFYGLGSSITKFQYQQAGRNVINNIIRFRPKPLQSCVLGRN